MRLLDYVPIKLAFFLILGILLEDLLRLPVIALFLLLALLLTAMAISLGKTTKNSPVFGFLAGGTTLVLGMLSMALTDPSNQKRHYTHYLGEGPQSVQLKIVETLKHSPYAHRYIARVDAVNHLTTEGKVLFTLTKKDTMPLLKVDDEIIAFAPFTPFKAPPNPYQFHYGQYMAHLGVHRSIRAAPKEMVVRQQPSATTIGAAERLRNHITARLTDAGFSGDELAVVRALFLGQRDQISDSTYDDYKDAGAVHILALSGLHIGILLLLINFLLSPLKRLAGGRPLTLVLTVGLLWAFAFLAGGSPSLIRACTMFSFVAYAMHLNRPSSSFNILALSLLFLLLLFDPRLIYQVGFQMSYAAVFAIVWLYPILQRWWRPKSRALRYLWQLLAVSIAAQLGVLPISLFYFHQFPGLFFVSNLLLIPGMGLVLGLGILVIFLALANALPSLLAELFRQVIATMNTVVSWVASQEAFVFKDIPFDDFQVFLAFLLVLALGHVLQRPTHKRLVALLCTVGAFQLHHHLGQWQMAKKQALVIPHVSGASGIWEQRGPTLHIYGDGLEGHVAVRDFKIGEGLGEVVSQPLRNSYEHQGAPIYVMDSTGIYPPGKRVHTLIVTGNPRINFDRALLALRPKQIVADGSNYNSSVNRWATSAKKQNIPFHHTGKKGAFYFKGPH
ncbi:ComEC/Rec2 family competence protein [Maribacter sp. 2307ULW6-5]|uniref:ComEC/Rec2 family competence protein n=1 Tax=Maribacter sp. 2307ULW6-5 TaxID=3386275 RepID=UPI0039BC34BC